MPSYIVVEVTVNDPVAYEQYKQLAAPTLVRYGGRYLVRGGAAETLEGRWTPRRLVVLEFANTQWARDWWSSPEYAAAKALRQSCASTEMILVEGAS